jgi:hypothetical protein
LTFPQKFSLIHRNVPQRPLLKLGVDTPAAGATSWSTEDYMTTLSLSSRIGHMKKLAKLPDATIQAFNCLWPEETIPNRVSTIASQLMDSS